MFFLDGNEKSETRRTTRLEKLLSLTTYWLVFSIISAAALLYPLLLLLPTVEMSFGLFIAIWLTTSGVVGFLLPERILPWLEQRIK